MECGGRPAHAGDTRACNGMLSVLEEVERLCYVDGCARLVRGKQLWRRIRKRNPRDQPGDNCVRHGAAGRSQVSLLQAGRSGGRAPSVTS